MSTINTGSIAKSLLPGVNQFYGMGYGEHPLEWPEIFDKETSTRNYEEDVSLAGFGMLARKNEGSAVSYDTMRQGFVTRYTHVVYALGFQVTEEMIEDCQYDLAFKKAKALGYSVRQTQETIAALILDRAFSSSYLGGDGLELCSTAHVNITGGTYQNELTTSADISQASLEQMCIDIGNFTDDRGLKIAARPTKLIIPVGLQFDAQRILKSELQYDTAENAINALKGQGLEIVVNHYLTDTDAFFLKTDIPDGLKCFTRRAPRFGQDGDFDTGNIKFKADFRASWGWSDAKGLYGSQGA